VKLDLANLSKRRLDDGAKSKSRPTGREIVGLLKKEGRIRMDSVRGHKIIFVDLAAYYFANEEFKKQSPRTATTIVKRIAVDIRPVEVGV